MVDGPVVSFSTAEVESPWGERFERQVVSHPGATSAVVFENLDGEEHIFLVEQYRVAVGDYLYEIPAGKLELVGGAREDPQIAIQRELREEIGREVDVARLLTRFFPSPGFCDEVCYVYEARSLREVPRLPDGPEESSMTIKLVRVVDLPEMMAQGQICDAKTLIGLGMCGLLGEWIQSRIG